MCGDVDDSNVDAGFQGSTDNHKERLRRAKDSVKDAEVRTQEPEQSHKNAQELHNVSSKAAEEFLGTIDAVLRDHTVQHGKQLAEMDESQVADYFETLRMVPVKHAEEVQRAIEAMRPGYRPETATLNEGPAQPQSDHYGNSMDHKEDEDGEGDVELE